MCKLPLYQRRALLTALIKPKCDLLELIDHREVPAQEEAGARLKIIAECVVGCLGAGWGVVMVVMVVMADDERKHK